MTNRNSLYWDDFNRRVDETVDAIKNGTMPPVRRVAVFITDKCNFKCEYCNHDIKTFTLSKDKFVDVVEKYGDTAIIHITGGEPSVIPWLYKFIEANGHKYRFHLNTNAYKTPPAKHVKRLKISLDSKDAKQWDCLVKRDGAFNAVVANIKASIPHTVVSLTYTLSHQNFERVVEFAEFANEQFVGLYALFFSVYKGTDEKFMFTEADSDAFFHEVLPELRKVLPAESLALINETIDEKLRLIQGVRFPSNTMDDPCYISMSERVITPMGVESNCSHLYRDGIIGHVGKHEKCLYGCNQRLVMFNDEVARKLK